MQVEITDPIEQPADLAGRYAKAWFIDVRTVAAIEPARALGGLGAWVIEAPLAHPLWHSYCLSLIHLRDVDGLPPAALNFLGASHELFLHALDPVGQRAALLAGHRFGDNGAPRVLEPMNFAAQFKATDDAVALDRLRITVQEICDGALSPDTDYRAAWVWRFGDNGMKLAARTPVGGVQ